jgi:hypothetical protein
MRTRLTAWLDHARGVPVYGVQVLVGDVWAHVAEDGVPILFDNEKDAEAERARLRKRKPPQSH